MGYAVPCHSLADHVVLERRQAVTRLPNLGGVAPLSRAGVAITRGLLIRVGIGA